MHGWIYSTIPPHSSTWGIRALLGSLFTLCAGMMVCGDNAPDTCGDYFYLPLFPSCNLFLETVPCFNHTTSIIVSMTTPTGERIHGFKVNYRSMRELPIFDILNGRAIEGVLVRSTYDISLYLHKSAGDSLIVYPIDSYNREYEVPNMTSMYTNINDSTTTPPTVKTNLNASSNTDNIHTKGHGSSHNSKTNARFATEDAILYLFSPFNSTSITITAFSSLELLPSTTTKTTIVLDAFEIHKHLIFSNKRYILTSRDIFAVVLIQPKAGPLQDSMALCTDMAITLFDFLPPSFMLGTQFYLAFSSQVTFTLILHGRQNVSVDILTETTTMEVSLGHFGASQTNVAKTSSAWISTSSPISVYVIISICSNSSIISSSSFISSALSSSQPLLKMPSSSSSDSSSTSSSSSSSPSVCSENGFFLPSVEHFFTCTANKSKDTCLCTCPSVFQREVHRNGFGDDSGNTSESTYFPLLVGELFDISTSISPAISINRTYDVVMTTNNSFMVFRHDFDNLNFLPAGSTLMQIYRGCSSRVHSLLLHSCQESGSSYDINEQINDTECSCDDIFNASSTFSHGPHSRREKDEKKTRRKHREKNEKKSRRKHRERNEKKSQRKHKGNDEKSQRKHATGHLGEYIWEEEEEDTTRPLIAVIVSLSVAIFAVIVLILGYMLEEWISQRKLTRNTKIRPFVS